MKPQWSMPISCSSPEGYSRNRHPDSGQGMLQLPSVGPENILSDLTDQSGACNIRTEEIFRQAEKSPIIVNAHRVRQGDLPVLEKDRPSEGLQSLFTEQYQPETVVKTIVELCSRKIPERFGLDPVRDIQVLSPCTRGRWEPFSSTRCFRKH